MKLTIFTLGLLSSLLIIKPAYANINNPITPNALITKAYQGYYTDLGIPSYGAFKQAIRNKKVTAEDLLYVAYKEGRLTWQDAFYNKSLKNQVRQTLRAYSVN